jgi:hypothetical protein
MPLRVLPTDGSRWNVYDDPYHFTPAGFPITKQVSYAVASLRPGIPIVNGFMGDLLVRGQGDKRLGKLDRETQGDLVAAEMKHRLHAHIRLDLLDPAVVDRAEQRARAVMQSLVEKGKTAGKVFTYVSLYAGQRYYLANNFLEHLDVAEPLLPFLQWPLVESRFRLDYDCFNWETYDLVFKRHFPELAEIPHNDKSGVPLRTKYTRSRVTRQWAGGLMKKLARGNWLSIVSRKKAMPRLLGAYAGRADVERVPEFLQKLLLLEQRVRAAGIAFDWHNV